MSLPPYGPEGATKSRAELKRERDVLLLYGAAFRDIPNADPEDVEYLARPSPDTTLTALCQLTAIRLGTQRSMVTIVDDRRQYVLAEATHNLSLRPEGQQKSLDTLWFGRASIPRTWGLCEKVLEQDPKEKPVHVVNDLSKSDHPRNSLANPEGSFFASAALLSPTGVTVGALCVFDDKPRDGLPEHDIVLLRELATTVVDYLDTYTFKDQYRRGEQFTRGLISFADGASAIQPFETDTYRELEHSTSENLSELSSTTDIEAISTEDTHKAAQSTPARPPSISSKTTRARSARHRSIRTLQDNILPASSRSMFSRAANVMMASSDLDGVLIIDASVVANGQRRVPHVHTSSPDHTSDSYHSRSSSSGEGSSYNTEGTEPGTSTSSTKMCQVLGVATRNDTGTSEYGTLLEPELARLFHEYPQGKVFTFSSDGMLLSSTEGDSTGTTQVVSELQPKRKPASQATKSSISLQALFPGARSVAFIPFWDYERSRWFAGCLCWNNNPYRLLSPTVDLAHFKVFSHSIMRELSRLDAMSLNHSKTTFVASISHELRSPLHGILGTLEFIKDTPLDSFQTSMLNSLNACGTTLLDTINHVMDYAKIGEPKKGVTSRRLKNANTIRLSSKPLKGRQNKEAAFDFGIATEEVVEAVFSGSTYTPVPSAIMDGKATPSDNISDPFSKRKLCYIILDVKVSEDWVYCFPVGSWRRIVMNVFGNAIKYTASGYIHVTLRASNLAQNAGAPTAVILTVTDSGSGMSPEFLVNKAFQPFSQENPHATGTGLGLSIVRQIIDTNGGKVEVSSDPNVGTKLTLKLALTKPEVSPVVLAQRAQLVSHTERLQGRKICILHKLIPLPSENPDFSCVDEGLVRLTNALAVTLEKTLKMKVVRTAKWEGHDSDIVICPELSFEYLSSIRRLRIDNKPAPVTVFIAMDGLEAATLRSDARITNRESVVEIMTQPCGPYKLAFILNRCLDRFEHPSENVDRTSSTSASNNATPKPGAIDVQESAHRQLPGLESLQNEEVQAVNPPTPPDSSTTLSTSGSTATEPPTMMLPEADRAMSHILIVDDNLLNRKLLVAFMRKHGLPYGQAVNGLEALQAYQDDPSKYEVILMDMSMPVMDGMTATRAIRQHEQNNNLRRSSIIALTGLASSSAKLEAWSSGIDHFMTKPINFKVLHDLIEKEDIRRQARRTDLGTVKEPQDLDVQDDAVP